MKRMTTSRREDPESEPEKSPNNGLECNCHPRHGSCVRTSRATGASPLSPDVRRSASASDLTGKDSEVILSV
jgi:hypothetical protein